MNILQSLKNKQISFLVLILITSIYGLSFYKIQQSYTYWRENQAEFFVENVSAMATLDAYWWLKMARDIDAGRAGKGKTIPIKEYPDLAKYREDPSLLAWLIKVGKNFTGGDYYKAGLMLIPLLAGLFVFPFFVYFHVVGYGASSILGALIGMFSFSYYSRTAAGFLDTDLLILFFPMTISAAIVMINRERSLRTNLILAALAGLAMYGFNWWYQRPVFVLIYVLFFAAYLLLIRLPMKQALLILLCFLAASGPAYLWQIVASFKEVMATYISPPPSGQIVWPDILQTIAEAQSKGIIEQLLGIHGLLPISILGFVGLFWLYLSRFRKMVPITPLVIIGVWSLVGPARFTMYLAPFLGVGLGVLIENLVTLATKRFQFSPLASKSLAISIMFAVFFPNISYTAYDKVFRPAVPAQTIKAFLEIKRIVPSHAAMFTWWDYGYPLMEIGEFATYHDNGSHGRVRSTLIAKALVSSRQQDLAGLVSCLEDKGFNGLLSLSRERNLTGDQLVSLAFNYPIHLAKNPVYLLYTENMVSLFGNVFEIGTWDFQNRTYQSKGYALFSSIAEDREHIYFEGGQVDLNKGIVMEGNIAVPLRAALVVKDGFVVNRIDYQADQGVYLQILVLRNQRPLLQVMEKPVFESNFNQQFILGNFDRRYFEQVYNKFPIARVFQVKSATH